jgi:hypothetical protein
VHHDLALERRAGPQHGVKHHAGGGVLDAGVEPVKEAAVPPVRGAGLFEDRLPVATRQLLEAFGHVG